MESLIEEELKAGFLEPMPSLQAAKERWAQVAIGKANVVQAPGKRPRLIIDPTVSGVNPACLIPERFSLPSLDDLRYSFPLRGSRDPVEGFTLDISAAHKTVRVREDERGLLGLDIHGKLYFYKVTPFGGAFSALWWARISGFLVRTGHRLLWISHMLTCYVDDLLLLQASKVLPMGSLLLLSLTQVLRFPISWRKLQLGPRLDYIGWHVSFRAGALCLPDAKILKLLTALHGLLAAATVTVKDLESVIGLLQWVMQLSPTLRPWLCSLYHDKNRPVATNFSVNASVWQRLSEYLDESLKFISVPPGTSISVGSQLLSARHVSLKSKTDLRLVRSSSKTMWLRVADTATVKRKLSDESKQFLEFWLQWCTRPKLWYPLVCPRLDTSVQAAADACAAGSDIGIGGWVRFPGQPPVWFAERFSTQDFVNMGVPVREAAQSDIVSYEALAQVVLVVCYSAHCRGGRLCIRLPALCDNSGAESVINKLFTTVQPLYYFLQKLATTSWARGIFLDTSHIAGSKNDEADFLSRWDGCSELPPTWQSEYRVSCKLPVLWESERDVRLFPANAKLLWTPPMPRAVA